MKIAGQKFCSSESSQENFGISGGFDNRLEDEISG